MGVSGRGPHPPTPTLATLKCSQCKARVIYIVANVTNVTSISQIVEILRDVCVPASVSVAHMCDLVENAKDAFTCTVTWGP